MPREPELWVWGQETAYTFVSFSRWVLDWAGQDCRWVLDRVVGGCRLGFLEVHRRIVGVLVRVVGVLVRIGLGGTFR